MRSGPDCDDDKRNISVIISDTDRQYRTKIKRTREQTMSYKTLHRKLKIKLLISFLSPLSTRKYGNEKSLMMLKGVISIRKVTNGSMRLLNG